MPVFGGIKEDILTFVLDLSPIVNVPKGDFFFRENDKGSSMFVLEKGKVAVLKPWKGRDYLLKYLESGDCFGEMALIDFCPRSASVLSVEDCTAIELTTSTLYRLYEMDLEQFTMIQMNMGREVTRRLREADDQLFQAKVEAKLINGSYEFHST
ncbi:MAG: cyclic nucleotide-binding domain-containing protein [Gammaproteobacteria bacterium]|nr:cyclic nucleotide-binding domain-containing protein [Gammaproteobacteria bacterium]